MLIDPLGRVMFGNEAFDRFVSPSGQRISTPHPDPGFFRATKVGRCSAILRICACGGPVQASYPATIKLTQYPRAGSERVSLKNDPK
jgi:hypothetical protein